MCALAARLLAPVSITLAAIAIAGCGGSGGGGGGMPFTTAGTTSGSTVGAATSGSTAPASSGSTAPGSTATTTGPPAASDRDAPAVALTAPVRGLFTTRSQVLVTGTVTDPSGVASLLVNGLPVLPGANGDFAQLVTLGAGLNVIEVEAADRVGNRARSALPVVSGEYLPEASLVADGLAARLNLPAFDAIERAIAPQLAGADLAAQIMARSPLYRGSAGPASIEVNATGVTLGSPTVDLVPRAGGLGIHVEIPNIVVRTRASGRVVLVPYGLNVNVTSSRAVLDATAVVTVAAGQVRTTLQGVNLDLRDFRFDVGGIPSLLEDLARNAVRGLIERQIEAQVNTIVPRELNKAIAGANGPITRTVLGRQITLGLVPTAVRFDAAGCSVLTHGDLVVAPLPGTPAPPTSPGSLRTPGAAPVLGTAPAVLVSLDDDLLNRMAHATWRAGIMTFTVDQARAQAWGLPASLQLDAGLLTTFFPGLAGRVNGSDPIELELSCGTPVLFRTIAAPGLLEAGIGDLTLSVWVSPPVGQRTLVMQLALQVQMGVGVSVAGNRLQLSIVGQPRIRSDVTAIPMGPLDPLAIETFVDLVLPQVLQLIPRVWSGFPLPTHPAINLRNVQAERDGDHVTVKGDI